MSRRRMNPISRTAWVVGGTVAAVAAAVGVGVLVHNTQTPTTPSSPGTPAAGVTPGAFVTYNAPAGNSSAQISTQNGLYIQLPTGSTVQNWTVDGNTQTGTGLPLTFQPSTLSVGTHALTVAWTDTTNTAQVSNITLTVTA